MSIVVFGAKYLIFCLIVLFVAYFLLQESQQQRGMLLLSVSYFPLVYVTALAVSFFYYDPRPFMLEPVHSLIIHAPGNGFPSDHMLLSSSIASVLFLYDKKLGIITWAPAILVGMSRVAAGVHHPIDIVGSALISVVILIIIRLTIYPLMSKWINLIPTFAIFTKSKSNIKLSGNNKLLSTFYKKLMH